MTLLRRTLVQFGLLILADVTSEGRRWVVPMRLPLASANPPFPLDAWCWPEDASAAWPAQVASSEQQQQQLEMTYRLGEYLPPGLLPSGLPPSGL